ncbi:MAG: hypothetical protein FD174_4309 [Geobacteraceae bacterium]|nr:MAG: hypothetical protein FD174_4309 [Geobacteraceae bacterium]
MLEHIIEHVKPGTKINPRKACDTAADSRQYRETILDNINTLHALSRRGLWGVAAFLLISIIALLCRDINILETFPENIRVILGCAPAPYLIHAVLAVSTISALIIIAGRVGNEAEPGSIWSQLGHRSAFYLFYFFSNALDKSFMVTFLAGLTVLLLEHYHIWSHYSRVIQKEKELLKKLSLWPLLASVGRK